MSQLPLFESTDAVLVDDATGRIAYTPRFVPVSAAASWFGALRPAIEWKAERRQMYDREVDVPRLTASFRLDDPAIVPPEAIRDAAGIVRARTGVPFTSVGVNLYRDGHDSVAPHNDHLGEITAGFPIVLLSLGATRRMTIREKEAPRRSFQVDLEAGSLLTMSYETQRHYTHAIPKTKDPVGERISLAFRVKPRRDPNEDDKDGFYR